MFKRVFLILLFLSLSTIPAFSKTNKHLSSESCILMDSVTKKILYSKNPRMKLAPASTVKIMTALCVLKKSDLKKSVVISKVASSMEPSKVYIKQGEHYSTEDLLQALLLNSGNDASVALAESVAGTEKNFVALMNKMAKEIGAKHTVFKNSNGLPAKGQYSTAYDMALIVREAMKDKRFVDIISMKYADMRELNTGRRIKLKNHNKSLWKTCSYSVLGKTGYTKKARHCFAGYIKYNKWKKVVVVILKGQNLWSNIEILARKGR